MLGLIFKEIHHRKVFQMPFSQHHIIVTFSLNWIRLFSTVVYLVFGLLSVSQHDDVNSANINTRGSGGKEVSHASLWSPHVNLTKVLVCQIYVHSFFLHFLSGSCESRRTVKPLTSVCATDVAPPPTAGKPCALGFRLTVVVLAVFVYLFDLWFCN